MTIQSFEKELQQLHPGFSIQPSRFEGLNGVYLQGTYLFAVPAHNIYDNENQAYGMETFEGKFARHRTRPEALAIAKQMLHDYINSTDYHQALTGKGKYSDRELEVGKYAPRPENPNNLILPG